MPAIIEEDYYKNYGILRLECIGILDYFEIICLNDQYPDFDCYKWSGKYHPRSYFAAISHNQMEIHGIHTRKDREVNIRKSHPRVAVFVPTDRLNPVRKNRPATATIKSIEKWQNSVPGSVLYPEWLNSCETLEDIIAKDANIGLPYNLKKTLEAAE